MIDGTLPGVSPRRKIPAAVDAAAGAAADGSGAPARVGPGERAAVRELVRAAQVRGEDLSGPDGLLMLMTKTVLESALEEEMSEHLGFDKHQGPKDGGGNIRNGSRAKTVLTEAAGLSLST